jgi:hypothetical protein
MGGEFFPEHIGQLLHAEFVVRVSDIENPAVAATVLVFDNPEKAVDTVLDIGETSFLSTSVHQPDGGTFNKIQDELGNHPGAADSG